MDWFSKFLYLCTSIVNLVKKALTVSTTAPKVKTQAFLVEDEKFTFTVKETIRASSYIPHVPYFQGFFHTLLDSNKVSQTKDDTDNSLMLCNSLRKLLNQYTSDERAMTVTIFPDADFGALNVLLKGGILFQLLKLLGDQMKLKLEISNPTAEIPSPHDDPSKLIKSSETSHTLYRSNKAVDYKFRMSFPERWKPYWTHDYINFTGTLKIKVCGDPVITAEQSGTKVLKIQNSPLVQLENIRKMLRGEILMEAVIVANDGSEYPCHSQVLITHSPVLKTMLEGKFKEAKSKRIEMKDCSPAAVKELLTYLYYWDLEMASEDSNIALELLECAHKYAIVKLEEEIQSIILEREAEWMDIAGAMRLFFFARNVESLTDVSKKAIMALKKNSAQLAESHEYKELLKEQPALFMELSNTLLNFDK